MGPMRTGRATLNPSSSRATDNSSSARMPLLRFTLSIHLFSGQSRLYRFLPVIIKILKSGLFFFMSFIVSVVLVGKIFYGDMPPTSVIPWCAVLAIPIAFLTFKIIGWNPPGEGDDGE